MYVDVKSVIQLIKKNLTVDLLKPYWRARARGPLDGHCYVATESFYALYGKANGWKPYCHRSSNGDTHWWLQNGLEILDITAEQFETEYDYSKGHKQFFVNYPSKRCKIIIERIKQCQL